MVEAKPLIFFRLYELLFVKMMHIFFFFGNVDFGMTCFISQRKCPWMWMWVKGHCDLNTSSIKDLAQENASNLFHKREYFCGCAKQHSVNGMQPHKLLQNLMCHKPFYHLSCNSFTILKYHVEEIFCFKN